jgi:hypothetical protein
MGKECNTYEKFFQHCGRKKPVGLRPLGRRRRRCEDNIKMDFREVACDDVDWIHLAHDRVQGLAPLHTVMKSEFHTKP